jgi:hypothetical protein
VTGSNVDIYRNRVVVATTANDGFYTDSPGYPWPCDLHVYSVLPRHPDVFESSDGDILEVISLIV